MVITTVQDLLKELDTPGILGVKRDGDLQRINKEILINSPFKELCRELNAGNLVRIPCKN